MILRSFKPLVSFYPPCLYFFDQIIRVRAALLPSRTRAHLGKQCGGEKKSISLTYRPSLEERKEGRRVNTQMRKYTSKDSLWRVRLPNRATVRLSGGTLP